MTPLSRQRRVAAEAIGTGALVTVVVGSGIAAQRLSAGDAGMQLLQNSTATALGLTVLVWVFGPISGAHLNPVITLADRFLRRDSSPRWQTLVRVGAQMIGGILGAVVAHLMFDLPALQLATLPRLGAGHLLGEVVATAGLVVVVSTLVRAGRPVLIAPAVGAYIGAAYWFTSSTAFANPAATLGRMFTDTFAGIAPPSVLPFVAAQAIGAGLGVAFILFFVPVDRTSVPSTPPHLRRFRP